MDDTQYRDAVVENRRKHGFEPVDEYTNGFDPVWECRDDDDCSRAGFCASDECVERLCLVHEACPTSRPTCDEGRCIR